MADDRLSQLQAIPAEKLAKVPEDVIDYLVDLIGALSSDIDCGEVEIFMEQQGDYFDRVAEITGEINQQNPKRSDQLNLKARELYAKYKGVKWFTVDPVEIADSDSEFEPASSLVKRKRGHVEVQVSREVSSRIKFRICGDYIRVVYDITSDSE